MLLAALFSPFSVVCARAKSTDNEKNKLSHLRLFLTLAALCSELALQRRDGGSHRVDQLIVFGSLRLYLILTHLNLRLKIHTSEQKREIGISISKNAFVSHLAE